MIELVASGHFSKWLKDLRDDRARARIQARILRLSLGNPGDVKPVGHGISEMRINYGPGYRVYFLRRGKRSSSCFAVEINPHKALISNWHTQLHWSGKA
jgi:putative addiction module killer protein